MKDGHWASVVLISAGTMDTEDGSGKVSQRMRILTYKRTHTGDPDHLGRFGVNDCMGGVRNLRFDHQLRAMGGKTDCHRVTIRRT